jgi:ubiquinone/menaquinone biosynthesis C-methylase UbiE
MTTGIILTIVTLAVFLALLVFIKVQPFRKPSLEGIEDVQAAQAYDRISKWPQFRALRRLIVREIDKHQPTGILADIGCGPGLLTMLIARKFPQLKVLGLDAAQEMITTANKNALSLGFKGRVEFREGNIRSLPVPDQSLDFAVSSMSLHHWSDPERGLAEIHRVVKPGGQVLLFDMRRDSRLFFYMLMKFATAIVMPAAMRKLKEPMGSILASYTLMEVNELFASSPFKTFKIKGGFAWMFAWGTKEVMIGSAEEGT